MRAAVYQRNLPTLGGGERYALDFARALREMGYETDVLAPPGSSLAAAQDRLGVDVDGLRLRELDLERTELAATEASADYDVFVNATYSSGAASLAPTGVFACLFPTRTAGPDEGPLAISGRPDPAGAPLRTVAWVERHEGVARVMGTRWWTDGAAVLLVERRGTAAVKLVLDVGLEDGGFVGGGRRVQVEVDDHVVLSRRVHPRLGRRLEIPLPPTRASAEHRVTLRSDTAIEPMTGRPLGVVLRDVQLRMSGGAVPVAGASPLRGVPLRGGSSFDHTTRSLAPSPPPELRTYTHLVADSAYTARWMRTWQGLDADVVYPSVSTLEPRDAPRENKILVVGRFFSGGHSKRQVELIGAFARMVRDGLDDWELHLVGGIDPLAGDAYLQRARAAAEGLPVVFHVGAPRDELEDLLHRSSILWQASGWGADPEAHPERFEHFGIALVEAMSAGVVPVALDVGGASEIIEDGVNGHLWTDDPAPLTRALIAANQARITKLGAAARLRAQDFTEVEFDRQLRWLMG